MQFRSQICVYGHGPEIIADKISYMVCLGARCVVNMPRCLRAQVISEEVKYFRLVSLISGLKGSIQPFGRSLATMRGLLYGVYTTHLLGKCLSDCVRYAGLSTTVIAQYQIESNVRWRFPCVLPFAVSRPTYAIEVG